MNHNRLTDRKIASLNTTGRYSDGHGLWLQVSKWGTKSWILRYVGLDGKPRQMGLGPLHTVSLADARKRAKTARLKAYDPDNPIDPVEERRRRREQARAEAARRVTFKECCERYIAANETEWKNEKHRWQWRQTLTQYCKPIADLPVSAIDTAMVVKCLQPIWNTKRETAVRLRGRIERVLAWATVSGFRQGDNPARWAGHLKEVFGSSARRVEHHAALPYAELPQFMSDLRQRDSVSARALEFLTLTASRTGEVIGATWDEVDLDEKVWTIPAERMKAGKQHRVPLTGRTLAILKSLPREKGNPHLFVGGKAGAPLSNMAMAELMKDMRPGFTPHGMRSTFRDWAADRTNYPKEIPEAALAHKVPDAVVAAYRRTTFFDKRRGLMEAWASYCASKPATGGDNVRPMRQRVA
jgi:integrase